MSIFDNKIYQWIYDRTRKNRILNHLAHKIMQSERIHHFPPYRAFYQKMIKLKAEASSRMPVFLEFEVTNQCNARCIMCPPEVNEGQDFLDHELFKRVAKEGFELGIRKINLTGGEPLLDRLIYEKIKYVKSLGYKYVHMFSNGSLLTESHRERLLESGLDSVTISIDSAIKEEYERIRRRLKYDTVVRHVKALYQLKMEKKLEKPVIHINMVALPQNKDSRQIFMDTFRDYADIIEIMDSHNFAGGLDEDTSAREYFQKTRYPCHLLFMKAVIHSTGYLKKCSIDYNDHARIANLNEVSLKEALYSDRFMRIKNNHLQYNFVEQGCDICTHKESWWVDN